MTRKQGKRHHTNYKFECPKSYLAGCCGCDCENGLDKFHKLVKESQFLFNESGEYIDKTTCLLTKAANSLAEAQDLFGEAENKNNEALAWLAQYGSNYCCNFNDPACVAIQEQITALLAQISDEQDNLTEGLFILLQSAKGLQANYEQLQDLQNQYNQCVHPNSHDCGCPCSHTN